MNSQVALVTGASSGIGRATALALHQAGFVTYATARRLDSLTDLQQFGLHTLQLDVTEEASRVAAIRAVEVEHGAVGVLVNNAGYGLTGPIEELALDAIRDQFETNVFGLVRLSQLVLPAMRRAGRGRIINVGSIGGTFTAPGSGAYHASKYAVESFSDALRMEVRPFGINVVLLQPTGVYTAFDKKLATTLPPEDPTSPYAFFKQNHTRVTEQMFTDRNVTGIIHPEQVAAQIVRVATVRHPRARYRVGLSAHIYTGLRRALPDSVWDRLMLAQFPFAEQPGTKARPTSAV